MITDINWLMAWKMQWMTAHDHLARCSKLFCAK